MAAGQTGPVRAPGQEQAAPGTDQPGGEPGRVPAALADQQVKYSAEFMLHTMSATSSGTRPRRSWPVAAIAAAASAVRNRAARRDGSVRGPGHVETDWPGTQLVAVLSAGGSLSAFSKRRGPLHLARGDRRTSFGRGERAGRRGAAGYRRRSRPLHPVARTGLVPENWTRRTGPRAPRDRGGRGRGLAHPRPGRAPSLAVSWRAGEEQSLPGVGEVVAELPG